MPFSGDLILRFYETPAGIYVIQGTIHTLISVIIVNTIVRSWKIDSPFIIQALHIIPIVIPPLFLPIYYLINPERARPEGKVWALLDLERIIAIQYKGISAGMLLILLMALTTILFIFQESIPVIRNVFSAKREQRRIIKTIQLELYGLTHEINIIEDEDYIIFSALPGRNKNPSIFISTSLMKDITDEEFEAALAHEAAHIVRSKRPFLIIIFIFRILMFFNPVTLVEFRKAVQEEEKICDLMAVIETKNPSALSSILQKFINYNVYPDNLKNLIEYSHNALLTERLSLLEYQDRRQSSAHIFVSIGILLTVIINYFII